MTKLRADAACDEFCRLVDEEGMRTYLAAKRAGIGGTVANRLRPSKHVRMMRNEPVWHWTRRQERLLLAAGKGELAALAKKIGRTYFAAYRHRERLLNCSDAAKTRKG